MSYDTNKSQWDEFAPEFNQVNAHAEAILSSIRQTQHPTLSLENEMNLSLYFVASKCRNSATRKKAISILDSTSKYEGVLHSKLAARVAARLVELEEEGFERDVTCEDLPNMARLHGLNVKFDPEEKRASLRYKRLIGERAGEVISEMIEWGGRRIVINL